jgi:hypothetical protein
MNISKHFYEAIQFKLYIKSKLTKFITYLQYTFLTFIVNLVLIDQLLILHVTSMFGKYTRGVAACMYF